MKTRIAKFIAESGIHSRRGAEQMIERGLVFVNDVRVDSPVFFVDGSEKIIVDGTPITKKSKTEIYLFHKPINTITSRNDPQGRKTIYDALPKKYHHLQYIGRLDYKTTGLLLMTNDGELARKLTLPENKIEREYIATLHPKKISEIKNQRVANALRKFLSPMSDDDSVFDSARHGMSVNKIKYAPMKIEIISRYPLQIKLTLTQGKKNEIRIVLDALGFMVKKLHRIRFGKYELGKLKPGEIINSKL
ncbi:MAG: hypothetical protein LBL75_01385 [Rickettsiales bacterium]|jgi:23S rRNA pseudouridine2605 synthase|nr:hypothetical protein [Rickettsiales bacterium]